VALGVTEIGNLLDSARSGNRRSLARLLTAIESGQDPGSQLRAGWTLGVTGPPGVGKSTLIGRMIEHWTSKGESVAVLAVDPTSPMTGGAILADRLRMGSTDSTDSVFVRSLATRNHPGGLMPCLGKMTRALSACGWSRVIIETVGSGQSEIRVVAFADRVLLIDGPDRGDIIQAEKAGILELADVIAINKADLPNAQTAADAVREAMGAGKPQSIKVHLVSAIEGAGVSELVSDLDSCEPRSSRNTLRIRERLIASWDSTLLSHPEIESYLGKIGDGSITVDEAIRDIVYSLVEGGGEP